MFIYDKGGYMALVLDMHQYTKIHTSLQIIQFFSRLSSTHFSPELQACRFGSGGLSKVAVE